MRKYIIYLLIFLYYLLTSNYAKTNDGSISNELFKMSIEQLLKIKVTTASRKLETIIKSPANIYVITEDELNMRGYNTLLDLLKDLPSTSIINRYSAFTSPIIRGLVNSKRLLLMFNGIPFNPRNGFGTLWANRFPIKYIKKVEFILGPYASLYGRNTFSGVINIITKKGIDINGFITELGYGKDNQTQINTIIGKKYKNIDFLISYYKDFSKKGIDLAKEYPEYYSIEARQRDSIFGKPFELAEGVSDDVILPWDNDEIFTSITIKDKINLQFQYNRSEMPKVGTEYTALYYAITKDNKLVDRTINTSLSYTKKLSQKMKAKTTLYYQDFDWIAKNIYTDGSHRWYAQKAKSFLIEQNLNLNFSKNNRLYCGFNFEQTKEYNLIASDSTKPKWNSDNIIYRKYFNLLLQHELMFNNLKLAYGLFFEKSNFYSNVLLPKLSIIYQINSQNIIKFLYSTGYLSPDPEITVTQKHIERDNTLNILGRKDLNPEHINACDLNYILILNKNLSVNTSIFHNKIKDMIQQVSDSTLPYPFGRTWKNIGHYKIYGFDISLRYKYKNSFMSFISLSYNKGKITDIYISDKKVTIKRLPSTPIFQLKTGSNYLFLNKKLNIYLHILYLYDRYTWEKDKINGYQFEAPNYRLKGYTITDLVLNTTNKFNKKYSITIGLYNIFDKKGFNPSISNYLVSAYSPIRRRWFLIKINTKF